MLLDRKVVMRSRVVGALSTVTVKSLFISMVVLYGTSVKIWIVCFTTTTDVISEGYRRR